MTASDIAAACGRIKSPLGADLLRSKYCADAEALRRAIKRLAVRARVIYKADDATAFRTAHEAMRAFLIPPLCPTCKGRATVQAEDLVIVCPDCNGEGYMPAGKLDQMTADMLDWIYGVEDVAIQHLAAAGTRGSDSVATKCRA
jgi:hypothetical protein